MTPSSRDRISVDLHGLKATLFERARARGVSPSRLGRDTLAAALGESGASGVDRRPRSAVAPIEGRVRLSLRMSREEAAATLAAARNAGLTPGVFVAGVVAGVPVLTAGASRADHMAALVASSAELSALSRNIHRLAWLLREGNVRSALAYREMLDTLAGDVRGHLALASRVLADLRPCSRSAKPSMHPTS